MKSQPGPEGHTLSCIIPAHLAVWPPTPIHLYILLVQLWFFSRAVCPRISGLPGPWKSQSSFLLSQLHPVGTVRWVYPIAEETWMPPTPPGRPRPDREQWSKCQSRMSVGALWVTARVDNDYWHSKWTQSRCKPAQSNQQVLNSMFPVLSDVVAVVPMFTATSKFFSFMHKISNSKFNMSIASKR